MTDASMEGAAAPRKGSSIHEIDARTRKRNASEKRFKAYGITAILIGLFFLVVLAVSIVRSGARLETTARRSRRWCACCRRTTRPTRRRRMRHPASGLFQG